jgi:hypothetical protein
VVVWLEGGCEGWIGGVGWSGWVGGVSRTGFFGLIFREDMRVEGVTCGKVTQVTQSHTKSH